jgi:putative metallohydrolase (TIGR04338 family)
MRERDTQRSRVYKAERDIWPIAKPLPTVKDMEAYADRLWKMKRFAKKYPAAINWWSGPPSVGDGRGQRRALGSASQIKMPLWSRTDAIVLHELSHTVTARAYGSVAAHGWQFCSTYLDLVLWMMGRAAHDRLKASFKASKVRFNPPRPKRVLTEAQRMAMIERLQQARRIKQAA